MRERARRYYSLHMEEIKIKHKNYYLLNKNDLSLYKHDWYLRNKKLIRQRVRVYTENLRNKVVSYYSKGTNSCACCGEKEYNFLTLDHINNDGAEHKRFLKTRSTRNIYIWIIKNNFPPIFQILCFNCNCGRYYRTNNVCPHQTFIGKKGI